MLVNVGKEGRILVLNRNHLGGYAAGASSNTNIAQDILGETKGLWSTPPIGTAMCTCGATATWRRCSRLNAGRVE
jgi:hypothetical protein